MTLQRWHKEALGAVVIALVFGLGGRYSGPTKTITTEKIVDKIVIDQLSIDKAVREARSQWSKEVKDHTKIKILYKEGKPVEKLVYVDRDTTSGGTSDTKDSESQEVHKNTTEEKTQEKTKTVEYARPNHAVSLLGNIKAGYPDKYTATTDYRLFGTVWVTGGVQFDAKDPRKSEGLVGLKLEF